ncbi:hypothetical protein QYE76_000226 [Lolium multiflorum]|uniref:Transposase (putative) gypsy type domain-containing protein n=1 Tax=Lolium multiflorum TaxID=4521 RepID=A0AAD8RH47_LOLMU|nr:hypothetical protein QYE76_000226 [Lolium multiflorum]
MYRIPGEELEPAPEAGEVVVFAAHFERGFGLPASNFFREFLDFYELQPHHLPGNAIFYLSSYASFMEGFVGLLPTIPTFARFYNLRINSVQGKNLPIPKPVVQCGACILTPRQGSPFYKFSGLESCRSWQQTFFYVRNLIPIDFINLPAYAPGAPSRANWKFNPKDTHVETNRIIRFMGELNKNTDITADDIVCAFISHRVLPLQPRAHKIGQMRGRRDPTRLTTFGLRKSDMVQVCFPRIAAEEPESFEPSRRSWDDEDPDPFVAGNKHKMGRTHTPRPDEADQNRQVHEHVTPLAAEVGPEFEQAQARKARKDKAPAPDAGTSEAPRVRKAPASDAGASEAPPAKRYKRCSTGPTGGKRKPKIPVSSGPPLVLTRSAPGMRPETAEETGRSSPPPRQSPASSNAGKAPSSLRGGKTSSGCAAPKPTHSRAEEDFFSPPELEDNGASNMGAGSEEAGRSEPLVPPAPEKKKKKVTVTSPSKAPPATSAPAKSTAVPPPAPADRAPPAPRQSSAESALVTAEQLTAAVKAATAPASGSQVQPLVLHTGRTAVAAGEKVSSQLGRVVELNRASANLGALQHLVDRWNLADLSDATLGVGKDGKAKLDPRGRRSTVQHISRLKHAIKEFDNAWHDANNNVLSVLDTRKQVFEELLWEHQDLNEAFAALKLEHSHCQAALPEASAEDLTAQVAALKAANDELAVQHQRELRAQREECWDS